MFHEHGGVNMIFEGEIKNLVPIGKGGVAFSPPALDSLVSLMNFFAKIKRFIFN